MHDFLIKNDCDGLFPGIRYISVNRNNKNLFAVAFVSPDLCRLHFCTKFLVPALQIDWLSKEQKVKVAYPGTV